MASDITGTHRHVSHGRPAELAIRAALFAALAIGGVLVAAGTDAWWTTALALACIAFAVAGMAISVAALMAERDGEERPARAGRPPALALAGAGLVTLVLAIVVPEHSVATRNPTGLTTTSAELTVHDFLTAAVVTPNAYEACQYLTPAEQGRIAALVPPATSCRDALTMSRPTFAGVQSEADIKALGLGGALHGRQAVVTVRPGAARPARFVLVPATAAELNAFQAPQLPWRIDRGAEAVLGH